MGIITQSRNETTKNIISNLQDTFSRFINTQVKISFGKHVFTVLFTGIEKAKLTELANPPEKKLGEDGRFYTPSVATMLFDKGKFHIYLEDIANIVIGVRHVSINMGTYFIKMEYA